MRPIKTHQNQLKSEGGGDAERVKHFLKHQLNYVGEYYNKGIKQKMHQSMLKQFDLKYLAEPFTKFTYVVKQLEI